MTDCPLCYNYSMKNSLMVIGPRAKQQTSTEWIRESLRYIIATLNPDAIIVHDSDSSSIISAGVSWQMKIPFHLVHTDDTVIDDNDKKMYDWAVRNAQSSLNVLPEPKTIVLIGRESDKEYADTLSKYDNVYYVDTLHSKHAGFINNPQSEVHNS